MGEDGETFALGGAGGAGGDAAAAETARADARRAAARAAARAAELERASPRRFAAILSFDDRGMVTLSRKVPSLRTANTTPRARPLARAARRSSSAACIKKAMAAETDGPPGAVAVGEALARLGSPSRT